MLTDKTLSNADYDAEDLDFALTAVELASNVYTEPSHKTRRRARRASERVAYDKAMLKFAADTQAYNALPPAQQKKTTAPIKPRDWRAAKSPMPTVCLWFSKVREKGGIITAKLGKLNATLPAIPEVRIMLRARDGVLIQVPVALITKQFGGRVWR